MAYRCCDSSSSGSYHSYHSDSSSTTSATSIREIEEQLEAEEKDTQLKTRVLSFDAKIGVLYDLVVDLSKKKYSSSLTECKEELDAILYTTWQKDSLCRLEKCVDKTVAQVELLLARQGSPSE